MPSVFSLKFIGGSPIGKLNLLLLLSLSGILTGCAMFGNPYSRARDDELQRFKRTRLPLRSTQSFEVIQGAFGYSSHSEPGNEYHWDFAVPFGTDVIAVEGGRVLDVFEPIGEETGGCDAKFKDLAHNIKIEHLDGTVAQYVHVKSLVAKGASVARGTVIARTSKNGWICQPHLHFGVYRSRMHLYDSKRRETLPLFFEQVPGGILREGFRLTDKFNL